MSEKRSLFDVIEGGREIEKDLNLTAMEKMSEGVDILIEMTQDAFDRIRSLEGLAEQTDALAAKTKLGFESHLYEDDARHDALVKQVREMSCNISDLQKYVIMLLKWAEHGHMARSLEEQIEKQKKKEEAEYPF